MRNPARSCQLPIYFPSPIITYLHYANILSMALTNENVKPLFYTYYIQMSFNKQRMNRIDFFPSIFAWTDNAVLKFIDVTGNDFLMNEPDILERIFQWINEETYIVCYLSDHLINDVFDHKQSMKMIHPFLISGYNRDRELLYSQCFNMKRHYTKTEIRFEDFYRSIRSEESIALLKSPPYNRSYSIGYEIQLYKIRKDFHYPFNKEIMKREIENFLMSRNSSLDYALFYPVEKNSYWGLDISNGIIDYLNTLEDVFDIRIFHCIREMISLWKDRCAFLAEQKLIRLEDHLDDFQVLEQKAEWLRMQALKLENHFYRKSEMDYSPQIDEMILSIRELFQGQKEAIGRVHENL